MLVLEVAWIIADTVLLLFVNTIAILAIRSETFTLGDQWKLVSILGILGLDMVLFTWLIAVAAAVLVSLNAVSASVLLLRYINMLSIPASYVGLSLVGIGLAITIGELIVSRRNRQ